MLLSASSSSASTRRYRALKKMTKQQAKRLYSPASTSIGTVARKHPGKRTVLGFKTKSREDSGITTIYETLLCTWEVLLETG